MRSILLLGDDSLGPYAEALEGAGYAVSLQRPGATEGTSGDFDAAVLDLASLGEDAAAKRLLDAAHAAGPPAVIAIIGLEQLAAFDAAKGPDDFILAGADPSELCARVRQALWRRSRVDDNNTLKCGELVMDLANYTVYVAARPVELTYKEYELLRFLATNPDRVFSRETLLNKVWGYDFFGGARTVDVHIRRLRSKIEDRHNTFIETVRNVGYRFRARP